MDQQPQMIFNRVAIHDPDVNNIEGASMLVPEGWTVGGGFVWMPLFSIQANLLVQVADPVTGASVFTLPMQNFVWSLQPMAVSMPIGSNWLGSVMLPPPRNPVEFVQAFYLPGPLQHLRSARIVKVEDLPQYAAALPREEGGTVYAARLRHAYEWGGRAWEENVYIILNFSPPHPAIAMWAGQGYAMRAPAGELDRMTPVLSVPIQSLRFSLDWSAALAHVRQLFQQNRRQQQINTRRLGEMLRQHREELRQMHQQVWEERQAAQDRQSFALREVLGGVETYTNPHESRTVELPSGYQEHWVSPDGKVLLSNDPMLDPRQGSNVDWRRMERYRP